MKSTHTIFEILKISLLIAIVVVLLIINDNMRVIGHGIMSGIKMAQPMVQPPVNITPFDGPSAGSDSATLTVTAFIDYGCIFCKQFFDEVYPSIQEEYIKTGKVKFVIHFLPLPIHKNSIEVAKYAVCANRQQAFWKMHNKLFSELGRFSKQNAEKWIDEIGLEKNKFTSCLKDTSVMSEINRNMDEAKMNNIQATPTFVIDNEVHIGMLPYQNFKQIIEEKLLQKKKQNGKTCK